MKRRFEGELQLLEEQLAYENLCTSEERSFDPFADNMYGKPKIPNGPYFAHLAATNFGASPEGAKKLYKVLERIPVSHVYHGKVPRENIRNYKDQGVKVIRGKAYDTFGTEMPGYVNIAVLKEE